MSGRRELMKQIVEGGVDLTASPSAWQGEMTIATRHTVYRFCDGLCVAVHRQDTGAPQEGCVGMAMTGWLVDSGAGPRVSNEWCPGASAVLLRPGRHGDAIALTSPTIELRREVPKAPRSGTVSRRAPRPPTHGVSRDSVTRIGVPGRAR